MKEKLAKIPLYSCDDRALANINKLAWQEICAMMLLRSLFQVQKTVAHHEFYHKHLFFYILSAYLYIMLSSNITFPFNLPIYSLTSGLGASAVALPPVSVLGAPATGPVLQPTVPGLGLIPGASIPVITQSIDAAPPSECLLLKNMFDPAVEVFND